jgi:Endonuclease/Exonuclease/phosphatase family
MPQFKVISWNIQTLGDAKLGPQTTPTKGSTSAKKAEPQFAAILRFVARVTRSKGADIVGIMEVRAGRGDDIVKSLVILLNNIDPDAKWDGRASSPQGGTHKEQYVFVWRQSADRKVTLDVDAPTAPAWLMGVLDHQALDGVYPKWGPKDKDALCEALEAAKYIEPSGKTNPGIWRVVPEQWKTLNETTQQKRMVGVSFIQSKAASQKVANKLVGIDILRFPTSSYRPPYVINFQMNKQPVRIALLHAPGPNNRNRFDVPGIMALHPDINHPDRPVLIMGDFNIKASEIQTPHARKFARFPKWPDTYPPFDVVVPRTVSNTFSALDLLGYEEQQFAGEGLTSLKTSPPAPGEDVRENPYDKFFFRPFPPQTTHAGGPEIVDVVSMLAPGKKDLLVKKASYKTLPVGKNYAASQLRKQEKKLTEAEKRAEQEQEAYEALKKQKGADKKELTAAQTDAANASAARDGLKEIVKSWTDLKKMIENVDVFTETPDGKAPASFQMAFALYRAAISDHLPIILTLTV